MPKKYLVGLLMMFAVLSIGLFPAQSFSYPSAVAVLDIKDIGQLSDSALTAMYVDTAIELEAIKMFHKTSGFNPKEYQEYKDLLRFRYELKSELQRRKLDVPMIEQQVN